MVEIDCGSLPERCQGCLRPNERLVQITRGLLTRADLEHSLASKTERLEREYSGVMDAGNFYSARLADPRPDMKKMALKKAQEMNAQRVEIEARMVSLPEEYGLRLEGFDERREAHLAIYAEAVRAEVDFCPGRPEGNGPCGLFNAAYDYTPHAYAARQASRAILATLDDIRL